MRSSTLHLFLLAILPPSSSTLTSPFLSPFEPGSGSGSGLLPRQAGNCGSNEVSCAALNFPNLCCPTRSICTYDPLNNPACCPLNAACTGTVNAPTNTPTSSAVTATITFAPTPGQPVPNAYFPFVYIATSFANSAVCSSALQGCQATFGACTSSLGSPAAAGVTVVANNGQVTVLAPVGAASAETICSSLSSRACYGLHQSQCATLTAAGTAQGTFVAGTVVAPGRSEAGRSLADSWVIAGLEFMLGFVALIV